MTIPTVRRPSAPVVLLQSKGPVTCKVVVNEFFFRFVQMHAEIRVFDFVSYVRVAYIRSATELRVRLYSQRVEITDRLE